MDKAMDNHAEFIVAGVGSGACRVVNGMAGNKIENVRFVCIDTDMGCLSGCSNARTVCIGKTITRCFGSGKGPGIGRAAAEESWEEIGEVLSSADMVFVIACMGGGTGTGAASVVAYLSKEAGKLTVGVAARPFSFESGICLNNAETGIRKLRKNSDSVVVVNNDGLFRQAGNFTGISGVFSGMVSELWVYVRSVADMVNGSGLINFDFADIKTVFQNKEMVYIGAGTSSHDDKDRYLEAARKALNNTLMEMELETAGYALVYISGDDVGLQEASFIASLVEDVTGEDSNIIFGVAGSDTGSVNVVIIASR